MNMDILSTKFVFHHVVLPPKIPQGDDSNPVHELALLRFVLDSLEQFQAVSGSSEQDIVHNVANTIRNGIAVRDDAGTINEDQLMTVLKSLVSGGMSQSDLIHVFELRTRKEGAVPLLVNVQNAAVIISHAFGEIHLEPFELTPPNGVVIEARGRLKRSFPSDHVVVSLDQFGNQDFLHMIARTLSRLSFQDVHEMQPKVRKAGQEHDETRDTTKPFLVTGLMMDVLAAVGRVEQVRAVEKNCREEVLLRQSYGAWHRSPTWLFVRVVLQITFARVCSSSGSKLYKAFMIFFLSRLLGTCCSLGLENEDIFGLQSKIAQRLLKFGNHGLGPWVEPVRQVLDKASILLQERWDKTTKSMSTFRDLPVISEPDVLRDTVMRLPQLESFIHTIHKRKAITRGNRINVPGVYLDHARDTIPTELTSNGENHIVFVLAAFERWVASHLPTWLAGRIAEPSTPGTIRLSMEEYYEVASKAYAEAPEMLSIMLLTIIELWVACDQSSCAIHETLKDYRPEIPGHLLQSLVLPLKSQMKRLYDVENYLRRRTLSAREPSAVTSTFGSATSFAVRTFNDSAEHQALMLRIQKDAYVAREQKRVQFRREKARYDQLMEAYNHGTCDEENVVDSINGFYERRHPSSCRRCSKKKTAQGLQIAVHEWPLPKGDEGKAAVFELLIPQAYNGWRDATLFVIHEVFKSEFSVARVPEFRHAIEGYIGLSQCYTNTATGSQRVTALSETKPHTSLHRKLRPLSTAIEESILVNNSLHL